MIGPECGGKAGWSMLRGIVCGDLGTMRCLRDVSRREKDELLAMNRNGGTTYMGGFYPDRTR